MPAKLIARRAGGSLDAVMRAARPIALLAALALLGCASGGDDPTRPSGMLDGGGGGDGGRRDGGGRMRCDPVGWGASCPMATDLGSVGVGERIEGPLGVIERRGGAQWALVRFPPAQGGSPTSMAGGGAPRVHFARNDGGAYRLEVRTECTAVAGCNGGEPAMATNLTEWSFTDDPANSAAGENQFSTREVTWPETIYLRVYAVEDPACGHYQIVISR